MTTEGADLLFSPHEYRGTVVRRRAERNALQQRLAVLSLHAPELGA